LKKFCPPSVDQFLKLAFGSRLNIVVVSGTLNSPPGRFRKSGISPAKIVSDESSGLKQAAPPRRGHTTLGGRRLCDKCSHNSNTILGSVRYGRRVSAAYEPRSGRIPIRAISPRHPVPFFAPKAYAGEVIPFRASIFSETHDTLGAELILTDPEGITTVHRLASQAPGTDVWQA